MVTQTQTQRMGLLHLFYVCVSIITDTMLKLMLMLTQTQTLRVNKALAEIHTALLDAIAIHTLARDGESEKNSILFLPSVKKNSFSEAALIATSNTMIILN